MSESSNSQEKFRWIDNDIDISKIYKKLPSHIRELIATAEQADRDEDEGNFICACEGVEVYSKQLMPDIISKKEWELICAKYWFKE